MLKFYEEINRYRYFISLFISKQVVIYLIVINFQN